VSVTQDELERIRRLRLLLWDPGALRPIAILSSDHPDLKRAGKAPAEARWPDLARQNPPAAASGAPVSPHALNTGILCDGLRVIDIDIDNRKVVHLLWTLAEEIFTRPGHVRWRANSSRIALICRAAVGEPTKRSIAGREGKIEILGRGQQIVIDGMHPSGFPIRRSPEDDTEWRLDQLTVVTEDQVDAFLARAADIIITAEPPAPRREIEHVPNDSLYQPDFARVLWAMNNIPNDGYADWNWWTEHLMALHGATGGSEEGRELANRWSALNDNYNQGHNTDERWDEITRSPPNRIGYGSLHRWASCAIEEGFEGNWSDLELLGHSFRATPRIEPEARTEVEAEAEAEAKPGDDLLPLFRELSPPEPFPVDALGPLQAVTRAIQYKIQAPTAICAQSVLAANTLIAQAHCDIEFPHGRRPLSEDFVTVAQSGDRKSAADAEALRPIHEVEQEWLIAQADDRLAYENDLAMWEAERALAKRQNKASPTAYRAALELIGHAPKPPKSAMVTISDPTIEAIILHLRDGGRPFVGLFSSEGGTIIGGYSMSAEKITHSSAQINSLWDGGFIKRLRVTTGEAFLTGRRCSMHLMLQPDLAHGMISHRLLEGIGLLARQLIVFPDTNMGVRHFRLPDKVCTETLDAYGTHMRALMLRSLPVLEKNTIDQLNPRPLRLSPGALQLWTQYHDTVEGDLGKDKLLEPIRDFGAKLAEHAGRLAGSLAFHEDPDTTEISPLNMERGIALAQHYCSEMRRLRGVAATEASLVLADMAMGWIRKRGSAGFTLRDLYTNGPYKIRNKRTAMSVLATLKEHGQIRLISDPKSHGPRRWAARS
jgi:hypothetical protein